MSAVPKVAIITNVIPVYRRAFYQRLLQTENLQVTIYCQDELKGFNLNLCHELFSENTSLVSASGLSREKLTWQHLPIRRMLTQHDHFVFYGNPRVFSNVVWSCLFKLAGKKVALWGQAHTAGASPISEALRLMWWRLFDNLFVYGDAEVDYLRRRGFKAANLVGMNNGLDQETIDREQGQWPAERLAEWQQSHDLEERTVILSCARLEPKNEFYRVVQVLPDLIEQHPNLLWCVIGSGIEETALKKQAEALGVANHIRWVGSIYEESELAPWFLTALVMVHPAAIGLSMLHAFGYGLPVVTHNNAERHMPEFAAMTEGKTGYLYQQGNMNMLKSVLGEVLTEPEAVTQMGHAALAVVEETYNVNTMASRFSDMVRAMS